MTYEIKLSYDEIMREKFGIIFIDSNEIIIRIYAVNPQGQWTIFRHQEYDLETFDSKKNVTAAQMIEIIAEASLSKNALHVSEWRIYARNIPEMMLHDITSATGISTELLTLQREQELLYKGILFELQ